MKRGKVISILRFFSTIDKEIQMNNATIEDLNDRYYITLGAVNKKDRGETAPEQAAGGSGGRYRAGTGPAEFL